MIIATNLSAPHVAKALLCGGVALLPTDTVYGLAASPQFREAVARIFDLKGRPINRNLPVMIGDVDSIEQLGVDLSDAAHRLLASPLVPGALTVAVGFRASGRPPWLRGRDEVAFRIPNHAFIRDILRLTGPLLVSSANIHGSPTLEAIEGILSELKGAPDVVVDGGVLSAVPSTLINCRKNPPQIERVGAVSAEQIRGVIS